MAINGIGRPKQDPLERFFRYTKVNPITNCWEWVGGRKELTYGIFQVNNKSVRVHRWAYEQFVGEIPEGMYVCHTCDVPYCVSPDHFFLGTPLDNVRDMDAKNRCPYRGYSKVSRNKGANNGSAKLTWDKVREIRQLYALGNISYTKLAKEYGVVFQQIYRIINNINWREG